MHSCQQLFWCWQYSRRLWIAGKVTSERRGGFQYQIQKNSNVTTVLVTAVAGHLSTTLATAVGEHPGAWAILWILITTKWLLWRTTLWVRVKDTIKNCKPRLYYETILWFTWIFCHVALAARQVTDISDQYSLLDKGTNTIVQKWLIKTSSN